MFQSKNDGRLNAQIADLNTVEFALLVFIGDIYDFNNKFDSRGEEIPAVRQYYEDYPKRIDALRASTALRVNYLECLSWFNFINHLQYYIRQMRKGTLRRVLPGNDIRVLSKKSKADTKSRKIAMLSAIEGVDTKTAKLLLDAFGYDVLAVLSADEQQLLTIKHIGPKTVEHIKEIV